MFYAHVLKSKILDFGGSPVSQKDVPRKSFERNVVLERSLGGYDMRNSSPLSGVKFCCDYMASFSPGLSTIFPLPPFCFVEYSFNAPAQTHVSNRA